MNPGFDLEDRIRTKEQQDCYTTLLLGSCNAAITMLSYLLLRLFFPAISYRQSLIPVVICLGASLTFWFLGRRDERWFVLCTILNHVGIGVGLYLLMRVLGLEPVFPQLIYGMLPMILLLVAACYLYSRTEASGKMRTGALGIGAFALVLLACGILNKILPGREPLFLTMAVYALICGSAFGSLVWTTAATDRSIHVTMALVSLAIYLILLAVAGALLYLQMMGKDSDRKSGSRRSRSSGGLRSSGGFPGFLYVPCYYYHPTRGMSRGNMYYDPARRRRASRFLKWTLVILAVLLTALLCYAFLH